MNWWVIIIGFELFIAGNAFFDAYKIDKKHWWIKHWLEGPIQFIVILLFSYMAKGPWYINTFFFLSLFWLQFDYLLNRIRKKHWWHLGDAFFDQILKGESLRYYRLGLKIILVVISLIILIMFN